MQCWTVNDKWRCHRKLKIVIFLLITIIMPAKQLQPKTCPCLVSWYSRLVAFFAPFLRGWIVFLSLVLMKCKPRRMPKFLSLQLNGSYFRFPQTARKSKPGSQFTTNGYRVPTLPAPGLSLLLAAPLVDENSFQFNALVTLPHWKILFPRVLRFILCLYQYNR